MIAHEKGFKFHAACTIPNWRIFLLILKRALTTTRPSPRPQTGDTGRAELAETRLIAQLHSDFVDVLEAFR